ncbi:MAG: uroporphyrinogen-III C-methyltransferase [Alphaproteobacteria bacterium]|nr:uroporphyrinogen-III C-methyltransferase [Alphaproteobacteria bacterium]
MNAVLPARLVPPPFDPGSVWLVGAGPGDPGLLTLHALHALTVADVVLHDALVAPEILDLANGRLIDVGKRAGKHASPQLRINQRLIVLARQNLRVVRLKGGDPLVFGRGGEEALALAAAGIPFRIVPGISAGLGATAGAGMPLTHRTLAQSVALIPGLGAGGTPPDDAALAALARGADVLVVYMARAHAGRIAERLIAAGRPHDEAVALVTHATTPHQQVATATLATAGEAAAAIPAGAPTLLVIGPVVALRDMLAACQQTEPMRLTPPARVAGLGS